MNRLNNAPPQPDGVGVVVGGSDVETAGPLPTVENTKILSSIIYTIVISCLSPGGSA